MKKLFSLVICVMALLFVGCEENTPATSNKVETSTVSNITDCSVVLHGKVNVDISLYEDIEFGIMISESEEDMNARKGEMYKSKVLIGKDFELALDRLTPETKYYYCAWLFLNKTQYEYGSIRNFITLEATSSEITCPEKWLEWKAQNELWLINNAQNPRVHTTQTGLQYMCIEPGEPNTLSVDDAKIVTIHYSGKLINGHEFDANNEYSDYVNVFIPGLTEGLKLMKKFSIYEFYVPYYLGYGITEMGTEGTKSYIPPYSTLIFRVKLLDVY